VGHQCFLTVIACDKREAFVQESAAKQSTLALRHNGLLRFARNDGIDASMTLEIIERFAASLAAPQRLAGGRAEFGQQFGILRTALRTGVLLLAEQRAARA
jgi:hypothetical protein